MFLERRAVCVLADQRSGPAIYHAPLALRLQTACPTIRRRPQMKLTGFDEIQFAEREGLTLNKDADRIDGPAAGLSIAEAEAIATDRPELIWLDVADEEYYGNPKNMEPER
jgi:hypothetical protein